MEKTVQELAEFLGGTVIGDGSAVISDIKEYHPTAGNSGCDGKTDEGRA